MEEITDGNAYLLLEADKDYGSKFNTWTPTEKGQKNHFGIYFVSGLKAIAAFTGEDALFTWKKKVTKYISLPAKALIEICKTKGIDRIVDVRSLPAMIVLERQKS